MFSLIEAVFHLLSRLNARIKSLFQYQLGHCCPGRIQEISFTCSGLWGAKVHQQRAEIARASLQMMYQDHWDHKGCDQGLMEQFLLPVFKQNMVRHRR